MNLPRLFRTSAVRLALRYALVYVCLMSLFLTALYWASSRYVDSHRVSGLEQELFSLTKKFDSEGLKAVAEEVSERKVHKLKKGRYYLLVGPDGAKVAGNLLAWPSDSHIPIDGKVHSLWLEDNVIPGKQHEDDAYGPVIAQELPDGSLLLLARNIRQMETLADFTLYLMPVILIAAALLALAMGVTLGRTILGRMDSISCTAGEIMAGDLSKRIQVRDGDNEFNELATRLNTMLNRVQQLITGMREVTDNVAHDLRSPLTRMRNRLEVTLIKRNSESEYREVISRTIEDTESLLGTFNALLGIAQMEAGSSRVQCGPVDLNRLACELLELYEPTAQEMGQGLQLVIGEAVEISGSRELLAQAIGNLLDNAIKYASPGGIIRLQVKPSRDSVEVLVSDSGPGIPEGERAHVFERFARLESARHTPGNGLGLSVVRAVARLHHAELVLGDNRPGLIVTLRFSRRRVLVWRMSP